MRLGGFVIHGNNESTLRACLESLRAVCDEVVAVDSLSRDASSTLVASLGIRRIELRWQGYGAARAAAAGALHGCDYLFFLDADEYLEPPAVEAIQRWRRSAPSAAAYRVLRHNWAELSGRRFLYRTDRRARLVRRDAARWTPEMIVHEALPKGRYPLTPIAIEHRFACGLTERLAKDDRYALLWAIRAFAEGRRPKPRAPERLAMMFRDLVLEGALVRGGLDAVRLAWVVSRYHAQKQRYLREVRAGGHRALVARFQAKDYAGLFAIQ